MYGFSACVVGVFLFNSKNLAVFFRLLGPAAGSLPRLEGHGGFRGVFGPGGPIFCVVCVGALSVCCRA